MHCRIPFTFSLFRPWPKNIPASGHNIATFCSVAQQDGASSAGFNPSRVLVLSKTTRYEFEKKRFADLNEDQLRRALARRGSDYSSLRAIHNVHTDNLERIVRTLEKRKIEHRVVTRGDYTYDKVRWADAIISAGGDGTFLLTASRVFDDTPVIGINTDPTRSEGFLALPNKCTLDFDKTMEKLLAGKFKWTWRQRIHVTVQGGNVNYDPIDLHEEQLRYPEYYEKHYRDSDIDCQTCTEHSPRILPVYALNEVFIGESLASRVSYYELSIDDGPKEKQKSSGLTVSTGSGSTSWFFNINKLPSKSVQDILNIVKKETNADIPEDDMLAKRIAEKFNCSLVYSPSDTRMAYTIRDPVVNGVYSVKSSRGFARKIFIRSRMWDACMVIDNGASFVFNDGAIATMEINSKNALRTISALDMS
ncbi:NAD kinase 2, mitochondrial-like [Ptychodera flava]|uniref:NAD kinase 2, mitochondrial-like n=1 Tax=Ptychodera flava TaxID=63121 RepID=UPI003969C18E